jgi:poly(A) polymerase
MTSMTNPPGTEQLRRAASLGVLQDLARARDIQVFLVGGTVRELVLGGRTPDLDLAVSRHTLELAQDLARTLAGTYILLDAKERTARVVAGADTLDLAEFRGPTLVEDLKGRDFTINAMALDLAALLAGGPVAVMDPWGGLADLAQGLVRMLAAGNLAADPLRLLRAYRFAATHAFRITPETIAAIQTLAPALSRVAGERVHYELFQLLPSPRAAAVLRAMDQSGLLVQVFPEVADMKGVDQNGYHHLDVFDHSLEAVARLEEVLAAPGCFFGEALAGEVARLAAQPGEAALLKVAALFHDVGKPQVQGRRADPERYTFYHHERVGVEIFQRAARRLRFSQAQTKAVAHYITWHMRPFLLFPLFIRGELTTRAMGRLVKAARGSLLGCLALAMADSLAGQGPLKPPDGDQRLGEFADAAWRFYQEHLTPARLPRLLSGDDLLALGLAPGPEFRRLLAAVEEAQWEGQVATREEALALVRRLV